MNKNSLFRRIISGILALVMVFGAFTALDGIFSGVKAETVNPDGSITYGASDSAIVLNKDAWLEPDGTYAIDLTAYTTGQKTIETQEFDAPTDFIIVVEQNCLMVDYYCDSDCYNYISMATYKLAAAKSIARALVDEIRGGSSGGVDHRVGIIGYGGHSCYTSYDSNTGLFDNTGRWYNYRFSFGAQYSPSAQKKYGSTLVHVNTNEGYNILKSDINKFNTMTASMGGYTDAGLEMAKGVINATKNDSYQAVDANGNVTNVPRKKVVVLISDGTPGYEGFDMKIAADAVNVATEIKKSFDAKIFTITLSTELEEQITAYDWRGRFFTDSTHADAVTINKRAYNPQYGKGAWSQYNSTIYSTLKFNYEEFFTRDFTSILSSAYPCTESSGPNGPITGKYMTNLEAYSYVGQGDSDVYTSNGFPMYYRRGSYATYLERNKSIGYFYKDAYGSNKLITGLYDNNVRTFNNRIPYNFHPVDKIADPAYGKYYIRVNDPKTLVNGSYNNPAYDYPTQALRQIVRTIVSEIPEGTSYTDSTPMNTIGEAYIKDIISEYFKYHTSFDPAVNVKTFTQDAIGYQNGEYVFANNIVRYNNAVVKQYDDVVTVGGFDYDANTCYRDANGVHGKKFIVQIRGLLAKEDTIGYVPVSNTPGNLSGLYSGAPSDNSGNGGGGSNNGSVAPITSVDLKPIKVVSSYYSSDYPKPAVLEVTPANADYTVTWYVSDTAIANVDEYGYVKAMYGGSGSTTLNVIVTDKITGREYRDSADVTIIRDSQISAISSVDLQPMTVVKGSYKTSNLIVNPSNTHFRVESWTSSNSDVADVGFTTGMVTGVSEGTANITAWLYDYETQTSRFVTAPVTVVDGTTSGGTNPNPNPNPNPGTDKLIVLDGDEAIFPIPSVNLREKHIVYDFSLVIKDERAEEFFAETRANRVSSHDVAHVLTLDDPYAKQTANGSGYNYHVQYPYDNTKHADLFEHFAVNISENGEGNSHAEVVIKSINGEQYNLAAMLQLTDSIRNANGYTIDNRRTDIVTGEKFTKYEWCRISFLPATNVHYEESLLTFNNATTKTRDVVAQWTEIGHANGATYDVTAGRLLPNVKHGDAQQNATHNATVDNYGHDAEYHNGFIPGKDRLTHQDSNNRAMTVKVDRDLMTLVNAGQAEWPTAEFTFTGTGLDLVSRTGADTGALTLDVVPVGEEWSYTATGRSLHVTIDTYYGDGLLYQIPIHHAEGLAWGEYKARVTARYMPKFDHQTKDYTPLKSNTEMNEPGLEPGVVYTIVNACENDPNAVVVPTRAKGTFNCVIDSIRVYNPHAEQVTKDHIYAQHNEENPLFTQVRDRLINAGNFGGAADRVSGIVYIDGSNDEEVAIEDYILYGPKNEAYLKPGNGFAFTVKEFDKAKTKLHISAKCPSGENVAMLVNGHKITVSGNVVTVDSATEMYFDVTDYVKADGRVAITCAVAGNDPNAILSIGNIKLVGANNPNLNTRGFDNDCFYVDQDTIANAEEVFEGEINTTLAKPSYLSKWLEDCKPVIAWEAVNGANSYEVWRKVNGGTYELAGTVSGTEFMDNAELLPLTKYFYKVRAVSSFSNCGPYSYEVNIVSYGLKAPTNVKAKISETVPVITWNAATNATRYEVYRSNANNGEYTLAGIAFGTEFTDYAELAPMTKYYYKVKAMDENGYESELTASVNVTSFGLKAPTSVKVKLNGIRPVVTWKAAANATKYEVYRSTANAGEYTLVGVTEGVSFTDYSELAPLTNYFYKVKALNDYGYESALTAAVKVVSYGIKVPTGLKVSNVDTKPTLRWKAAANATEYEIYRSTEKAGEYTLVGVAVGTTSFTDYDELAPLTNYFYKVKAIDDHGYESALTAAVKVVSYGIKAPASVKAVISEGKPRITWKAAANATEYRVYRSTVKDGEYDLVGTVSTLSFIDNDQLAAYTRYYYKVVAADNNGFESVFSAIVYAVTPK